MRVVTLASVLLFVATALPAQAQGPAGGAPDVCQGRPNALGVSRVVEIDTVGGPRFGQQQYKDVDFLNDGEVVLTFDDGPLRQNTRRVLDALSQHCTRATFFMVGRMAASDPETVREVIRRGHTVGTHTWSHRNLRTLPMEEARREVELGLSAIRIAAGGPVAPFFRFPYLSDSDRVIHHLRTRDQGIFSIDVDSLDYRTASTQPVIQRVLKGLESRKKGIVLFHDIQPSTAHALRSLLDQLAERRYRIVHLVPKQAALTVASYDVMAEKEFSRRKLVLAANPLASRAMTWPQSSQVQVTRIAPALGTAVRPPPTPHAPEVRYSASGYAPIRQAEAPSLSAAAPTPAPVVQPRPRSTREPTWQQRAFGTPY